jgi:hypothetical protein
MPRAGAAHTRTVDRVVPGDPVLWAYAQIMRRLLHTTGSFWCWLRSRPSLWLERPKKQKHIDGPRTPHALAVSATYPPYIAHLADHVPCGLMAATFL